MKKRYQVFVSSTYKDLREERATVIQMVLNLNHFPAGMEMFPAANEDQWRLIQRVIDESDYYIVVVGGRYGDTDEASGISYTEREYDYAIKTGTPVLGFLHKEPENIPAGKTDQNDEARKMLAAFRKKVEGLPVKYFTSAAELGGQVAMSLVNLVDSQPAVGWVRGDTVLSEDAEREILKLRAQLAEAREKSQTLVAEKTQAIGVDPTKLAQGEDSVEFPLRIYSKAYNNDTDEWVWSTVTWNDVLATLGPSMIDEATEEEVEDKFELCLFQGKMSAQDRSLARKTPALRLMVQKKDFETVLVHFRTLGIIESGTKKRVPSDTNKYLRLTTLGQEKLAALKVVTKAAEDEAPVETTAKKTTKATKKAPAKKAAKKTSATKAAKKAESAE
ncbi:hypothetical protein A5709_00725 [Mycobacterium sp. E1386]|uniref:DUF4062 domain-containing protein n=1 Tax=Mycobacterium sp. E1386 TaxID=1834126 RepID=UPI0008021C55|nr:DUF4062 domain-containing protein [Mycobacterium sp. E1386]OBI38805.1 hypothetical protein A5709_00725 [Mycobacterium sp. E1386]